MVKVIKEIGMKRAILSDIFRFRNLAVKALDQDDERRYKNAVIQMRDSITDLEAI